ncbi:MULTISPECIES: hypothetical protein [Allobacillus]|uniref:DUF5050 domain-containing protein n=1 Tax=Allobacillus salarius TaxID=1955272 RepID=A0A556PA76_9BACI|nr:hypothetical protein [Allobacillus salarius]TSJ61273.1 hypothetical protein FPQ13_11280 [Allobacillus salarius]
MKKYIKTVVLIGFVVLSIGTYYVYTALASSENPELSVETVSGDETLLEPITLLGVHSKESMYNRFKLDQKGSTYESDLNLIDQIDGTFQVTKQRLEHDYRSFMRGKDFYSGHIYEDAEQLVIVESNFNRTYENDISLTASWLDKNTEKSSSIDVDFPGNNYSFANIMDVQMNDNVIQVFANMHVNTRNDNYTEIHLMEINADTEELIGQKVLLSGDEESDENSSVNFTTLRGSVEWAPNEYIVIRKQAYQFDEATHTEQITNENLYAYDVKNKQMKELDMPEDFTTRHVDSFDGSTLYYYDELAEGLRINSYQIEEGSFSEDLLIDVDSISFYPSLTHQGNLYLVTNTDKEMYLQIFDLSDGQSLYKGKINATENEDLEDVHIEEIVLSENSD